MAAVPGSQLSVAPLSTTSLVLIRLKVPPHLRAAGLGWCLRHCVQSSPSFSFFFFFFFFIAFKCCQGLSAGVQGVAQTEFGVKHHAKLLARATLRGDSGPLMHLRSSVSVLL